MNYARRENLAGVTLKNVKALATGRVLDGCSSFEWQRQLLKVKRL